MDIDTLRNALMGLKGKTPEIPYDTEANQKAAIEQANAAVENPNTQTKPERIEAVQEQESLETPQGQLDQAREIASVPSNPSAETNIRNAVDKKDDKTPQPSPEMLKYKALIDKMEALQNKPKQETTWQDSLPDALAGLHNIINYNAGNPMANMQIGSLDKKKAAIAAGRKEEIGGLKQLQDAYGKYMALQDKNKDKKGAKNKIFQTRSGLVQLGEDGKPVQIYKDPYMESGRKVKEDSLDLRKDKYSFKEREKKQDDAGKALSMLRTTPTWKDAETTISNIGPIQVLLDDAYKKGGQSLSMLGPRVAKGIAGEVGVLTESDVTRYVKNPELVEGMLDSLSKIKSGKLTKASYDNIKRLLDISKSAAQDKMNKVIDREAVLLSRREGIPFEEALRLLDEGYKTQESEKRSEPKQTSEIDMRIQRVMDANPGSTYEQVKKALKAKGKL